MRTIAGNLRDGTIRSSRPQLYQLLKRLKEVGELKFTEYDAGADMDQQNKEDGEDKEDREEKDDREDKDDGEDKEDREGKEDRESKEADYK